MKPNHGALRHFGQIKSGTTPLSRESEYWNGDVKWATPEDLGKLRTRDITSTKRTVTNRAVKETNLSVLPVGSVLISTRAPIGHMALVGEPMAFNQGCRGIIPDERTHGPFLFYLLKARAPELNATANGTTFVELSRDDLASVRVDLPPLTTQQRIARFLDEKTAQIDGLIQAKRALLDRLAEKRQALITRAVTRGLDPDVPTKPSGVDWLGDVPAHWDVLQLRRLVRLSSGDFISGSEINEVGLYPVYGGNGLRGRGEVRNTVGETVIIGRQGAHCGNVHITERESYVTEHSFRCLLNRELDIRWLAYLLELMNLGQYSVSAAQPGLSSERLLILPTTLPTLPEQTAIANHLDLESDKLRAVADLLGVSTNRLTEYRAALVTAAVTGQIGGLC